MKSSQYGIIIKIVSLLIMSGLIIVAPAQFHHHADDGDICICGLFHIAQSQSESHHAHDCGHHSSSHTSQACGYKVLDNAELSNDNHVGLFPDSGSTYEGLIQTNPFAYIQQFPTIRFYTKYILRIPIHFYIYELGLRAPPAV